MLQVSPLQDNDVVVQLKGKVLWKTGSCKSPVFMITKRDPSSWLDIERFFSFYKTSFPTKDKKSSLPYFFSHNLGNLFSNGY